MFFLGRAGMSLTDHRESIKAFLAGVASGHVPDALVTSDFHAWTTSSGALPGERYRGGVGLLAKIFARPLQMDIISLTAEEDRVVAEVQSQGTLITGEDYRNTYVFVFRLRDGRVASLAEHFNPVVVTQMLAPLMRQVMAQTSKS
jgi:ketosteroid isomerase-like protein